jgi:hypothetical protein
MGKGTKTMKTKMALPALFILVFSVSGMWAGAAQEPKPEIQPEEVIVPEGTVIPIVITAYLNTRSTQVGDTVYADTLYPIWIQQRLVVPKGSNIRGTVTEVIKPGKIQGKGRLAIRFNDILLPNGVKRDLIAAFRGIHSRGDEKIDSKSETVSKESGMNREDVGTVVGTTSSGAITGAVVRGGTGALVGAGVGAAGGIATVIFSRDRNLVINPGTQFDLELKRSLNFAYNELEFTASQINSAERTLRMDPPTGNPRTTRRPRIGGIGPFPGIGVPLRLF